MLIYSLKRFLLYIPVLWLLITVIFLLSKILPGTYGSESIQYSEGSGYSKSTQQQRNAVYRYYLKKTGQDLPIFYVGISTFATPHHTGSAFNTPSHFLEKLSWKFSNPEKAKLYINNLNRLSMLLKLEIQSDQLPLLYHLQNTLDADSIKIYSKKLSQTIDAGQAQVVAAETHHAALELVQNEKSYIFFYLLYNGTELTINITIG